MRYFFCRLFVLLISCVCHAFASVCCCLVVTCWGKVDLLALVCDVYCVFVTFPCGILGQVWYLIISFPDLCHLLTLPTRDPYEPMNEIVLLITYALKPLKR